MPNIGNLRSGPAWMYLRALVFGSAGLFSCSTGFCLEDDIGIHDPSTIVRYKGRYYLFGTGRGIPMLCSDDLYTWGRAGRVFGGIPESVKQYVPKNDGQTVWGARYNLF